MPLKQKLPKVLHTIFSDYYEHNLLNMQFRRTQFHIFIVRTLLI